MQYACIHLAPLDLVAAINHTADHTIWCFFLTKQYTTDIYLQQQYAISSQMQL